MRTLRPTATVLVVLLALTLAPRPAAASGEVVFQQTAPADDEHTLLLEDEGCPAPGVDLVSFSFLRSSGMVTARAGLADASDGEAHCAGVAVPGTREFLIVMTWPFYGPDLLACEGSITGAAPLGACTAHTDFGAVVDVPASVSLVGNDLVVSFAEKSVSLGYDLTGHPFAARVFTDWYDPTGGLVLEAGDDVLAEGPYSLGPMRLAPRGSDPAGDVTFAGETCSSAPGLDILDVGARRRVEHDSGYTWTEADAWLVVEDLAYPDPKCLLTTSLRAAFSDARAFVVDVENAGGVLARFWVVLEDGQLTSGCESYDAATYCWFQPVVPATRHGFQFILVEAGPDPLPAGPYSARAFAATGSTAAELLRQIADPVPIDGEDGPAGPDADPVAVFDEASSL